MALIDSTTNGINPAPGSYSVDFGGSTTAITAKYTAAASSTLFPGLFAGRDQLSSDFTVAQSLDQVVGATEASIIGVVAMPRVGSSQGPDGTSSMSYDDWIADLNYYGEGSRLEMAQETTGFIYVFAGADIAAGDELAFATTTTGSGVTTVLAGSLVTTGFASPNVSLAGLVTLNPISNGSTYARGDLVPVSLAIISR